MKTKIFCIMVLCTGLLVGCDKELGKPDILVKPPIRHPEEPEIIPSTSRIIKLKIGENNMLVGTTSWQSIAYGNGIYVAVGDEYVTTSKDGVTWEAPKKTSCDLFELYHFC